MFICVSGNIHFYSKTLNSDSAPSTCTFKIFDCSVSILVYYHLPTYDAVLLLCLGAWSFWRRGSVIHLSHSGFARVNAYSQLGSDQMG